MNPYRLAFGVVAGGSSMIRASTGFVDDRGVKLPCADAGVRRAGLWHDRGRRRGVGEVLGYVIPLGAICWLAYEVASGRLVLTSQNMWVFGVAAVYGLGVRVYNRFGGAAGPSGLRKRAWAPIAWLAAHRHCGACGYGLAEVPPDAAGVAVCPECGAGWHRDRWTMAGQDPRQNRDLVAMIDGHHRPNEVAGPDTDDRGIPVGTPKWWYPRWIDHAWVAPKAKEAVREKLTRAGSQRWMVASLVIAGAWLIGVCVMMWVRSPLPRDWWGDLALFSSISGVIAVVLVYVASRVAVSGRAVIDAALAAGLCPNCGEKVGGRAGFDGCRVCQRCARAWWMERGAENDPAGDEDDPHACA